MQALGIQGLQLSLKINQTQVFSCKYCQFLRTPIFTNIYERRFLLVFKIIAASLIQTRVIKIKRNFKQVSIAKNRYLIKKKSKSKLSIFLNYMAISQSNSEKLTSRGVFSTAIK